MRAGAALAEHERELEHEYGHGSRMEGGEHYVDLMFKRKWLELRRLPQILLVLDFWLDVRSINTKLVTFYST